MHQKVEAWMFRSKHEFLALFLSTIILILIGVILSTFNVWIVLIAALVGLLFVHLQQSQYLGSAIRVYNEQFPEIFDEFVSTAEQLEIPRASLYIKQDPNLNAFTLGINKCTVVLTSALVEQLTPAELKFVLAHELGHYKARHTIINSLINPIGMNNLLSTYIFGFWQRKAEYSADMCGLIITKDIDSAISSLIKISIGASLFKKMNMQGYITQVHKSKTASVALSEMLSDHPLVTNRIRNLLQFWREHFTRI